MTRFDLAKMHPCKEFPEHYAPDLFYLGENDRHGQPGEPEFLAVGFLCPCGCGDKIYLPLDGPEEQRWSLKMERGRPTITPSIKQRGGCESHFFLTAGEVVWC